MSLPTVTISHARPAKRLGGFGLVAAGFTNAYQPADLSLPPFLTPLPSPPPPGRGHTQTHIEASIVRQVTGLTRCTQWRALKVSPHGGQVGQA